MPRNCRRAAEKAAEEAVESYKAQNYRATKSQNYKTTKLRKQQRKGGSRRDLFSKTRLPFLCAETCQFKEHTEKHGAFKDQHQRTSYEGKVRRPIFFPIPRR